MVANYDSKFHFSMVLHFIILLDFMQLNLTFKAAAIFI